jgi:hypothetical protein
MALPIVYKSPKNPNVDAAKAKLKTEAEEKAARRERYLNAPVPNYICFAWLFPNFDPKTGKGAPKPLPKCHKCEGTIFPMEHHDCPGFTPKYVEHTPEWKEKQEARREEIRESRRAERQRYPTCSVCGEEIENFEAGQYHWDAHEGRPERVHQAVDGEPDGDLDGYEDEPEEDYCEGDDDGYDCD